MTARNHLGLCLARAATTACDRQTNDVERREGAGADAGAGGSSDRAGAGGDANAIGDAGASPGGTADTPASAGSDGAPLGTGGETAGGSAGATATGGSGGAAADCPEGTVVVPSGGDCSADGSCIELPDGDGCAGADASVDPAVFDGLELYPFEVVGDPSLDTIDLPADILASPQWGVVQTTCEQDGFSFLPHTGQSVHAAGYEVNRVCDGVPVRLQFLTDGDEVVCLYLVEHGPDARLPGVPSIVEAACR